MRVKEPFVDKYQEYLYSDDYMAQQALRYLTDIRGLTDETIKHHGLGYCPRGCEIPGLTDEERLTNRRLMGCVVVPIYEEFGKFLGFAARAPSEKAKGWWNQRFAKGNHIYLLNESREHILNMGKIIVMEGYIDVLWLYQAGIFHVGGLMGTSLGLRRIGLIARYCDHFCLCFDVDKNFSGQKAQLRSIYELTTLGVYNISKIALPQGVDPDEYVRAYGPDDFLSLEKKLSKKEINAYVKEFLALQKKQHE